MSRFGVYAILGVIFVFRIPFTFPETQVNLINRMFVWGLFAMAYDFMFGFSGIVSFGHAALFGIGAYTYALILHHTGPQSVYLLLLAAMLASTIYAFTVGVIIIRTREVYFAILTLAFAQIVYIVTVNWTEFTQGFDGVVISVPPFEVIPGVLSVDLYDTLTFYYFVLAIVVLTFLVLRRLARSPMGEVLRGIRENIDRLQFIGFDERQFRIAAFTISGTFSGLAGGLYATDVSFAGPDAVLNFVLSGEVIVWTIIGGKGTLLGPLLGGGLIYYIQETVSSAITWWLIPVGILFILMILFMPEGIAGRAVDLYRRFREPEAERETGSGAGAEAEPEAE